MKPILEIRNLSKQYRIGGQRAPYESLRESLAGIWQRANPFREREREPKGSFWALRGIDFDVYPGESIGIIGRNGAGKSTLLKILSKITPPTEGYIRARGRVASLLEVGTGFHHELTGRENIYLNGSILGLKKVEIDRKFDEIVDFSGVEAFLDTPLKHYSSGMQLRLAFAVAAHLEPEILVIDEVLAVGDAEFQKKCLGKMGEVSKSGRTILFVSHNMGAVRQLCSRGIVLQAGKIVTDGPTETALSEYLNRSQGKEALAHSFSERSDRRGSGKVRFTAIYLQDEQGRPVNSVMAGDPVSIALTYTSTEPSIDEAIFRIEVVDYAGTVCFLCNSRLTEGPLRAIPSEGQAICTIPRLPLNAGQYSLNLYLRVDREDADILLHASSLFVEEGNFFKTGKLPNKDMGLLVDHSWTVKSN